MTQTLEDNDRDLEFSITEIRIDALRFPIIMGCYVLLPLFIFAVVLSCIVKVPMSEFGDPMAQNIFLFVSLTMGPGCSILNKLLPKVTFSYNNGVFTKEKDGKTLTITKDSVSRVEFDSPVMPDTICFYLHGQKKPVKVSMKGFKSDDRFDIPPKVLRIMKTPLTSLQKQVLEDFENTDNL